MPIHALPPAPVGGTTSRWWTRWTSLGRFWPRSGSWPSTGISWPPSSARVTARLSRLEAAADDQPLARLALRVKKNLPLYLSATQLGVTISSLGLGAVMEPAIATRPRAAVSNCSPAAARPLHVAAFAVSFAIGTSLHIVIGEQVPKNWAIRNGDRVLPYLAPAAGRLHHALLPAHLAAQRRHRPACCASSACRIDPAKEAGVPHTADELRDLLEQSIEDGALKSGHAQILTRSFDFGDLKVRQIMTPRTEVDYLTLGQPIGEVLRGRPEKRLHPPARCATATSTTSSASST